MKKYIFIVTFSMLFSSNVFAVQNIDSVELEPRYGCIEEKTVELQQELNKLLVEIEHLSQKIVSLSKDDEINTKLVDSLNLAYKKLNEIQIESEQELIRRIEYVENTFISESNTLIRQLDSLEKVFDDLSKGQKAFNQRIDETNTSISANKSSLENRTIYGVLIFIVLIAIITLITLLFLKRIKKGFSSISEIRKAQSVLQSVQTLMQEESVKLDNKLLEIAEQQIKLSKDSNSISAIDHSLILKITDELTRIEMNLYRMDTSIKGYKQLSRAVQRIKEDLNSKGYEIVEMLGKTYNDGMKAIVTFISDDTIEKGKQVITKIIKPQVNFNGQMIQSAQIEVSQHE